MATRTYTEITDDLSENASDNVQTRTFALEGVEYEIDLGDKNTEKLYKTLAPFIESGRRVGGRARRGSAAKPASDGPNPKDVRAWAAENDIEVSNRGRIPGEIVQQYLDANG